MDEPRAVVSRFIELAWNEGRLDDAATCLAPDLVDHDALDFPGRVTGARGLLQVVAMIRAGLPDLERRVEVQLVDGDTVTTRFVDEATHTGELMGIPPTGRRVRVRGMNIERVRDGRIAELWHIEDMAGLMAQLSDPLPDRPTG